MKPKSMLQSMIESPGLPMCECDVAEMANAAFNGKPRPLCPKHDTAEIARRGLDAEREKNQAEAQYLRDLREELRAEDELARRHREREAYDAGVEQRRVGVDPFALALGDLVGAPDPGAWTTAPSADGQLAIGDDAAFVRKLTDLLGPNVIVNRGGDFRDAA